MWPESEGLVRLKGSRHSAVAEADTMMVLANLELLLGLAPSFPVDHEDYES